MESRDPERVVSLPQGFAMLPLDEGTCEAIGFQIGLLDQYLETAVPFEDAQTPLLTILQELSMGSVAVFLMVNCFGGPCSRRGVVFQDGLKMYDRCVGEMDDLPAYVQKVKTGMSYFWAGLFSKPLVGYVLNPDRVPSVSDEVFELLGVRCYGKHHDAFDELKLGKNRRTRDWLQHEA